MTPHSFRHTYATLSIESNAPLKAVQNQLGHTTSKMTMDVYTGVTDKEKNLATEMLSEYVHNKRDSNFISNE
ncbi:tyrosine-type recombinase/integrase [Pediococcus acidilactici]|nr:tyrosine-type recombinase/integrase [Pediococcus acidilactici]KAF0389742.1 tyrosine-type recombinase/integrase [Pediococcus acidilactici]